MFSRPITPRSIGGVLDDAIRLYRQSFAHAWPLLIAISLTFAVPSFLLGSRMTALTAGSPQSPQALMAMMAVIQAPSFWLTYVIVMLLYLVFHAALIAAINAVVTGNRLSAGEALAIGLACLPRVFFASMLLGFCLIFGSLLFVIPGIYLWGCFQLVFIPLILERTGIFESFGVSNRLIKGYWWRSVITTSVAIIIMFVVSLLAGFLSTAILALLRLNPMVALLGNQIVGAVLNVFLLGWVPSVLITMYYDLRLRHQGEDLAARVDALATR